MSDMSIFLMFQVTDPRQGESSPHCSWRRRVAGTCAHAPNGAGSPTARHLRLARAKCLKTAPCPEVRFSDCASRSARRAGAGRTGVAVAYVLTGSASSASSSTRVAMTSSSL